MRQFWPGRFLRFSLIWTTVIYKPSLLRLQPRTTLAGIVGTMAAEGVKTNRSMRATKEATTNHKGKSEDSEGLDLFSGFIRLHVLHHASEQAIYGLWLIEEL